MEVLMLADPDAIEITPEATPELHRLFVRAIEAGMADDAACRGELPTADELAGRAADGACDSLSQNTARLAQRFAAGGRFKGCRWRVAALLTLRGFSAWRAYCCIWPVLYSQHLDEFFAELAARRASDRPGYLPPACGAGSRRAVRTHPRTGPPSCWLTSGVPVICP